jgi:predicted nucleotidyltransferase
LEIRDLKASVNWQIERANSQKTLSFFSSVRDRLLREYMRNKMKQQQVLRCLTQDQEALRQYGVESLSLFGSVAREEENDKSDVDLLVTFGQPVGLFSFLELKDHLEGVLGARVDLVTKEALHPRLRKKILGESIHVI